MCRSDRPKSYRVPEWRQGGMVAALKIKKEGRKGENVCKQVGGSGGRGLGSPAIFPPALLCDSPLPLIPRTPPSTAFQVISQRASFFHPVSNLFLSSFCCCFEDSLARSLSSWTEKCQLLHLLMKYKIKYFGVLTVYSGSECT